MISDAWTVIVAPTFDEVVRKANTDRAVPEWGGMLTSSNCKAGGGFAGGGFAVCKNDAYTPGGGEIVIRKLRSREVRFWAVITNARCKVPLNGFAFCGEASSRPCVMRLE